MPTREEIEADLATEAVPSTIGCKREQAQAQEQELDPNANWKAVGYAASPHIDEDAMDNDLRKPRYRVIDTTPKESKTEGWTDEQHLYFATRRSIVPHKAPLT